MAKKGAFGQVEFGSGPTVVGEVASVSFPRSANEIDVTVMGSGYAAILPGTVREGLELRCFFEAADAGQLAIETANGSDTPSTIIWYPLGNSSGNPSYTGTGYVMGNDMESTADGAIELTITFTNDGAPFTRGTVT